MTVCSLYHQFLFHGSLCSGPVGVVLNIHDLRVCEQSRDVLLHKLACVYRTFRCDKLYTPTDRRSSSLHVHATSTLLYSSSSGLVPYHSVTFIQRAIIEHLAEDPAAVHGQSGSGIAEFLGFDNLAEIGYVYNPKAFSMLMSCPETTSTILFREMSYTNPM